MMMEFIIFDSYQTPLFIACDYNNFEVARYLIINGANVNKGNKDK